MDNTTLNLGSGGDTIATDDISGVKYQRVKLIYGSDGVNSGDVATGNGLPVLDANSAAIKTAVELIDNAISGSEMQVDVVASLPSGTNTIGSVKITDGTDSVDVVQLGTAVTNIDKGIVTNTVIHGLNTGGGGSYVDVKVKPSGQLSVSLGDVTDIVGQQSAANSIPVVLASDQTALTINALPSGSNLIGNVSLRHRNSLYSLHVPASAAGANKVHLDLFNATGSGRIMKIYSVMVVKDGSVAVTGTLSVKLYLTRTTSVGTGGTAATTNGTTITSPAISSLDTTNTSLPAQVTARSAPSGGAAAGAVITTRSIFSEETNAAYEPQEMLSYLPNGSLQSLTVRENEGIRIVQGAIASVGNLDFNILFELE